MVSSMNCVSGMPLALIVQSLNHMIHNDSKALLEQIFQNEQHTLFTCPIYYLLRQMESKIGLRERNCNDLVFPFIIKTMFLF